MQIPTPKDLILKRIHARSVEGTLERITRVMTGRPDLDYYTFDIPFEEVTYKAVVAALREAGWSVRYIPKSQYIGMTIKIEVSWPKDPEAPDAE